MKGSFFRIALARVFVFFSVPVPAQTCDITRRKADNPHMISGAITIPASRTVGIEPG
jgi:hypothetical protein